MVIVIGGGPAGSMAAVTAAQYGAKVLLIEKNEKIGKKWFITGKGRCNLTNDKPMDLHMENIKRNPEFLYSAFHHFNNKDIKYFFESRGLQLKTERGDRVFPSTDKSSDTIKIFEKEMINLGVEVLLNANVLDIKKDNKFIVKTKKGEFVSDKCIIATGGVSYPTTGSTGDGYKFAKNFNHKLNNRYPSLVPLDTKISYPNLAGLSLKNILLKANFPEGEKKYFGELLFTHSGISGPIVLEMSADAPMPYKDFDLSINLKPALNYQQADKRLLRDIKKENNKNINNILELFLPKALIPVILDRSKVSYQTKGHSLKSQERKNILNNILDFKLESKNFKSIDQAIVTRGGIDLVDVNGRDMSSKRIKNLYFCGECLDLDALTGGYNMQIAWSTGYLAGYSAAISQEKLCS